MKIAIITNRREDAINLIAEKGIPRDRAVIVLSEKDVLGHEFERVYLTYDAYSNPVFSKLVQMVDDIRNTLLQKSFLVTNIERVPKEEFETKENGDPLIAIHLDYPDLQFGDIIYRTPVNESHVFKVLSKMPFGNSYRYLVSIPGAQPLFTVESLAIGDRMIIVGALVGTPIRHERGSIETT